MGDLSKIPLVALTFDTKVLISTLLNPTKWLLTDDGLPRDWRGLAHLWELAGEAVPSLAAHSDPTGQLLTMVQNKTPSCTIKDFESMLAKIDRWDVVDDARTLIEKDADRYVERMNRCGSSAEEVQADTEKKILTMDDLYRVKRGMGEQCYDAFVLYADEDSEFIDEMIDVLEKKHGLKLCLKDRDLMGGIPFEHEAVMQLISERCNRLIVVVSPDFLKSSANGFFLNFAQAVGIGTGQRKIIPCLYKKCQLPPQLAYQFILDYGKKGLYDFWGRLHACVQVITPENRATSPLPTLKSMHPSREENCENEKPTTVENNVACASVTVDSLKRINGAVHSSIGEKKPGKSTKMKKLLIWPKKKREKDQLSATQETVSISLDLPSLDNLSSLDSVKTKAGDEPTKRKKNLVGTCVTKVQSFLSKQQ